MDVRKNPYSPGAGSQPPELAGRRELLEEADIAIDRTIAGRHARSVIYLGLRGVGKTVLLNRVTRLASRKDCLTFAIEAPEERSLPSILVPRLLVVLQQLDVTAAAKDVIRKARRVLGGFAKAFKLSYEGFEVSLDVDPTAASGLIEQDLPELLVEIGRAAEAGGRAVVFGIDEVQYLSRGDLSALVVGIHRVDQWGLPLLFFGSGLPQVAALAGEAKSYAERLFAYRAVGALDDEAAREALVAPADELGVAYAPGALARILAETKGYPYFLQEWGKHAWDVATASPITEADTEVATRRALTSLDEGFFGVRYDRLTPREQDYALAMARLGPGPHGAGAIAEEMGIRVQQAGPIKASLTKKGMVYSPTHGQTAFTVPLFDEFVLRRSK